MQKHDIRVTALIISIGAIMMLGTLFFSIEYSRREAQKTMDRNISDLKKQINDYNEFLAKKSHQAYREGRKSQRSACHA